MPMFGSVIIFIGNAGINDGYYYIGIAGGDVPHRLDVYSGVSVVEVPLIGIERVVGLKESVSVIVQRGVLDVRFAFIDLYQLFS